MKFNVRKIRLSKLITQLELSKRSGVSQPYLSEIEKGIKQNPSLNTLRKIANGLEVDLKDLFEE